MLTKGAPKPIYYGTSAVKAGLLAGIESYSMILALNTDAALAKFTKGEREWEMGVDASVAVAKVGAGGALDTTNLKKDIVSFIFGDKGLMGDVSFSGSRFKKARGQVTPGSTSHPGRASRDARSRPGTSELTTSRRLRPTPVDGARLGRVRDGQAAESGAESEHSAEPRAEAGYQAPRG